MTSIDENMPRNTDETGDACKGSLPRILVHICCAPCSIAPIRALLSRRAKLTGYFRNPNIHPRSEFERRLSSVKRLAELLDLEVVCDEVYAPADFILGQMKAASKKPGGLDAANSKKNRCDYCYAERMEAVAKAASEMGYDGFTSSLLYSMSQDHDEIKRIGLFMASKYGVDFLYEDFRKLWNDGIGQSKAVGLYRQQYCGCAFSRAERYAGTSAKKKEGGMTVKKAASIVNLGDSNV